MNKKSLIGVSLLIALLLFSGSADADWRDRLNAGKEKIEAGKEGIQSANERRKERAKEREEEGGKSWQEKARDAGKKIQEGSQKAKKTWDRGEEKRRELERSLKASQRRAIERIGDPKTRREAVQAYSAVVGFRKIYRETKSDSIKSSVKFVTNIPMGNGMNLGEVAAERLARKFPSLKGTGLLKDPEATTVAIISSDRGWFLEEVKVIKGSDGRPKSVNQAIRDSSPLDPNKTARYFEIAGAAEGLATADDPGSAAVSLFNAIDVANK